MASPVVPIQAATAAEPIRLAGETGRPGVFEQAFSAAIGQVEGARSAAAQAIERILSGEAGELHSAVLAVERAELNLELFLQVRNKVVQAYQEIMRMQV